MSLTLIILHGWGQSTSDWLQIKTMYEKDFSTTAFDLPGFGNEPLISSDWGVPEYSKWVKERIKSIPGDKVILGHSFGGRIASYVAHENPEWLKGLILYGSPSIYRPSQWIKAKSLIAKYLGKLNVSKSFKSKNKELIQADSIGLGSIFRKVVVFDQTSQLPNIKIPTLLVWGEYDDSVSLLIAKEMKSLIPNSSLTIIDQAGHNAHKENTYLFYGITKNFIKSI